MLFIKAIPTTIVGNIPNENYIKNYHSKGYVVFTYDATSNTCLVFDFDDDEIFAWDFINKVSNNNSYVVVVKDGTIINKNT